jgi:hypothetical protein
VRMEIDREIAAYPSQKEAPSFHITRAFGRSKAVVWLDSEYAVAECTREAIFGAVQYSGSGREVWKARRLLGLEFIRRLLIRSLTFSNFAPIMSIVITQSNPVPR